MHTPANTHVGDRVVVSELVGYVLEQNRPFCCRTWRPSTRNPGKYTSACEGDCGGNCNGTTHFYPGTVTRIINWMDNSVEAVVACDDGKERRLDLAAPSGDACF